MAHGAAKHKIFEWLLRAFIFFFFLAEALILLLAPLEARANVWGFTVGNICCLTTLLMQFQPLRRIFSFILTALNSLISGGIFFRLWRRRANASLSLFSDPVFVAASIPHLNGLFIYVTTLSYLLCAINPDELNIPNIPLPLPLDIPSLFNYNWLGLVALSFCGVGVFVSRKPKQCLSRLGITKVSAAQIGIGLLLVLFSFTYDALWAIYTHNSGGDLARKLTNYNAGAFGVVGGFAPSVVLALATAIFAGMGEETLMRGALQPALGIIPAAVLHGVLHGQFSHAPIFILQIIGWSTVMGIVRRYTNTTTTIIGHAGFNFVTTFLFAFNP